MKCHVLLRPMIPVLMSFCLLLCSCSSEVAKNTSKQVTGESEGPHGILKIGLDELAAKGKDPALMDSINERFLQMKATEPNLYKDVEPLINKLKTAEKPEEIKSAVDELKAKL